MSGSYGDFTGGVNEPFPYLPVAQNSTDELMHKKRS